MSPNQSKFAKLEIGDNEGLIWDHEEINPLTVTGSFFLGMKDAVVDTVGSIAEIFTNLSGTLKSTLYLFTIFSSPLFESEQKKVVLSLGVQIGDWIEKEILNGNENDIARASGYIPLVGYFIPGGRFKYKLLAYGSERQVEVLWDISNKFQCY